MSEPALPIGWISVPLATVLDRLHDGRTLHHGWSPQCEAEPSTDDTVWGVLKTTAIQHGQYLEQHNKLLPSKLRPRINLEVKAGDILLTCAGPRVRCGVPCLVRATRPRLILSGKMYRFRVRPDFVEPRFMEAYLQSPPIQARIDAMKTGISDSGLNLTHERFHHLNVLLPPLAEQTRIADRIDELFTDLAAGVAALTRVKRNLSRYRAAVLHAAVTGRLTEAWRERHGLPDEAGPKLLERILAERRSQWERRTLARYQKDGRQPPKHWRDRYPEPSPPKPEGREHLPTGWGWATVDQVTRGDRDSAYGVLVPGQEVLDGVPLVRIGDIRNGRVDVAGLKRIAPSVAAKFQRTFLEGGELLMSLVGTIGRTAIAPPESKGANTARAVGVIPLSPLTDARFVEFWFRNPTRVTEMTLKSHEVARKTLNLEDVRPTLVALPPLAEQSAIVEAVNEKLSQIDGLEAEVERGLARAARLRQAILKAAFEGRLVPQDPADEPASVLLKRLRKETENQRDGVDSGQNRAFRRTKAVR